MIGMATASSSECLGVVRTGLNALGLLMTMGGVYTVYRFSPINYDVIDGGDFDDEKQKSVVEEVKRRNHLLRMGVGVVLAGTFLQFLSNFLPAD